MADIINHSSPPNYKLFGIVLGAVAFIAITSAFVGCITAEFCKRRRQKQISKVLGAQTAHERSGANSHMSSASTLARSMMDQIDEEDAVIESRTANLLAHGTFVGRELQEYKMKIRNKTGEQTALPVCVADLIKWAKRTLSSEEACPQNREPAEKANTVKPSRGNRTVTFDTSNEYEDPQQVVMDLEAQIPQHQAKCNAPDNRGNHVRNSAKDQGTRNS